MKYPAPEFEIVCVRAGRLRPKAAGFEPANEFQEGFPDGWLYTEDDVTMEFEIKRAGQKER